MRFPWETLERNQNDQPPFMPLEFVCFRLCLGSFWFSVAFWSSLAEYFLASLLQVGRLIAN